MKSKSAIAAAEIREELSKVFPDAWFKVVAKQYRSGRARVDIFLRNTGPSGVAIDSVIEPYRRSTSLPPHGRTKVSEIHIVRW